MRNEDVVELLEKRIDRLERGVIRGRGRVQGDLERIEKLVKACLLVSCAVLSFLIGLFIRSMLS